MQIVGTLVILFAANDPNSFDAEYRIDFRKGNFDNRQLRLINSGSSPLVKPGPSGLLTTMPSRVPIDEVGFAAKCIVKGDFEITVCYEILDLAKPNSGYGVGPGVHVVTASKAQHAATLSRRRRVKEGDVYVAHAAWDADVMRGDGERVQRVRFFATKVHSGKLRLVRSGKMLRYLVSDGDTDVFSEIDQIEFTDADVELVGVSINRGGAQTDATVLWKDFALRAEQLSDLQSRSSGRGLLVWTILGLVGLVVGLGMWYWRRVKNR